MAKGAASELNSKALEEQKRKVLVMYYLDELSDLDEQIDELKEARKALKKKAAIKGIIGKDLEFGLKAAASADQQVPADEYRRHGEILSYLGIMPNFQPTLFLDRAPADERIRALGERAGLMGRSAESGYAKGSHEDQWWMTGFDNGSKLRAERLAEALEEADAKERQQAEIVKSKQKGAEIKGDLPPEASAKKAEPVKPDKTNPAPAAATKKRAKPSDANGGLTNAEQEEERQRRADFVN